MAALSNQFWMGGKYKITDSGSLGKCFNLHNFKFESLPVTYPVTLSLIIWHWHSFHKHLAITLSLMANQNNVVGKLGK